MPLTRQQLGIEALVTLVEQPPGINAANGQAWQAIRNYIIAYTLSVNTIRNYLADFGLYLRFLGNREAALPGKVEVIEYMVHCLALDGLSNSTANCRLNTIHPVRSKLKSEICFTMFMFQKSSVDNECYTGYASDLKSRLKIHNEGLVASTKNRRPFTLIYFEEVLFNKLQ